MSYTQETTHPSKTTSQKYSEALGFQAKRMVCSPYGLMGMHVGLPNSGKTSFWLSCPDAYILNCDLSSTPNPNPKATVWPGISDDGRPLDPVAGEIRLTWKALKDKLKLLRKLSKEELPRPRIVVLDGINTSLHLVKDHVAKYASSVYRIHREDNVLWGDLNGQSAWDRVYEELVKFGLDLRSYGYGVFYILHLTKELANTDTGFEERLRVNVTPNFWGRLFPHMEMVFASQKSRKYITESQPASKTENSTLPVKVSRKERLQYELTFNSSDLDAIVKPRVKMPDVIVVENEESAWEQFASSYDQACSVTQE